MTSMTGSGHVLTRLCLRGAALPIERFRLLPSLLPRLLPEKERSPLHLREGFESRGQSVLLPEDEDSRFLQCLFRDHISVPYRVFIDALKALDTTDHREL